MNVTAGGLPRRWPTAWSRMVMVIALVGAVPVLPLGVGVRPAAASGPITVYSGVGISSPAGIAAGPDGAMWFTNEGNNSIGRITTGGTVTNYSDPSVSVPHAIAAGPDGAM